jgi:hypothetical protein
MVGPPPGGKLDAMQRRSRFDDAIVNTLALAWLARGLWRFSRGRAPWRPR